jgi:hypothetical protein
MAVRYRANSCVDYTTNQASYDLARLRLNELIDRVPGKNRYRLTSDGLRFAIFYTKLHDRLLRPSSPPTSRPPATNTKRTALHRYSHRKRINNARLPLNAA